MEFNVKWWLCCQLTASFLVVDSFGSCMIEPSHSCTYTVICEFHPTSISNPSCSDTPNVTFIIKNSVLDTLTSGFFSTTNFDSRVRQFVAKNNHWTSIDTSAFKYYSKTVKLDLSGNEIESIDHEAFSNLVYATSMNLSNNKIQSFYLKSLYLPSRGNSLLSLDLSNNVLSSLQNDVFSSLTVLLELNLENNKIASMGDDCFSNLKDLKILNLKNNAITSLNMTLVPLRAIEHLDLSNNLITKLLSFETSRLSELKYLNLSNNMIEAVDASCFSQAVNLQILDLSYNKIPSPIEAVMFMKNNLLWSLNLYENKITTIEDNVFKFNRIRNLNIERNNLTGNISRNTLRGLYNLTSLNLTNQHITGIEEKAFVDMQFLQYLNLSRNDIQIIDNSSFEFEVENAFIGIDVSYNLISDLYFLKNFNSNIIELYLNNNKIKIIPKSTFENHKKIKMLDISNNAIIVIEQYSLPFQNLQYLIIKNNKVSGNITSNVFSPGQSIRFLDLSCFKYEIIGENAFVDMQLLTTLNISYNELKFVHANNFKNMEKMYSLDLSHNKLLEVEIANNLDNLKAIYLNNNKFTRLPKMFSNVSEILYIDISSNNISNLTNAGFENILNTKVLRMTQNQIEDFNNEQTNKLTKLTDLFLNLNNISTINLTFYRELVNVDLSNNLITDINSTMYKNMDNLQYLNLGANNISILLPGIFQHLTFLKVLNLSSNFLTNLRYGSFRGLNRTETLDLSKNKLTSLDVNVFHECAELRNLIIDYNFIKTVDVERLMAVTPNMVAFSLGGNPIKCEEIVRNIQVRGSVKFEVTSIHKIFHEDNVHGIKCGENLISTSTEIPHGKSADSTQDKEGSSSMTTASLIWCLVLTIVGLLAAGFVFYYRRGKICQINRNQSSYKTNSFNISTTDCNDDLLG